VHKTREEILGQKSILDIRGVKKKYEEQETQGLAADPIVEYMNKEQLEKLIAATEAKMKKAAKEMDFMSAAQFRDEVFALKKKIEKMS
jgi:excinuclease ABC subunit B